MHHSWLHFNTKLTVVLQSTLKAPFYRADDFFYLNLFRFWSMDYRVQEGVLLHSYLVAVNNSTKYINQGDMTWREHHNVTIKTRGEGRALIRCFMFAPRPSGFWVQLARNQLRTAFSSQLLYVEDVNSRQYVSVYWLSVCATVRVDLCVSVRACAHSAFWSIGKETRRKGRNFRSKFGHEILETIGHPANKMQWKHPNHQINDRRQSIWDNNKQQQKRT